MLSTLTVPNNMGKVARTPPANTTLMIAGPDFGSDRKMWWISGSLPYRRGLSDAAAAGVSKFVVNVNARDLYPVVEPKEPMTMLAEMGVEARRNCDGRSLVVWNIVRNPALAQCRTRRTNDNCAFPDSLTLSGYEMSSFVVGSSSKRKAWCGRFAVLPSCVVNRSLRLSASVSVNALARGPVGESLEHVSFVSQSVVECILFHLRRANSCAFTLNGNRGICEAP